MLPAGGVLGEDATVPAGLPVAVAMSQTLSSADARPGQTFYFQTTADVVLGDVSIPKGTRGHGVVMTAVPGTKDAKGQLSIAATSLDLADGRTIPVAISQLTITGSRPKTNFIPLPLPFALGGFTVPQKQRVNDATLEVGNALTVTTVRRPYEPPPPTPAPSVIYASPTPRA
jgi:hypothetical protein